MCYPLISYPTPYYPTFPTTSHPTPPQTSKMSCQLCNNVERESAQWHFERYCDRCQVGFYHVVTNQQSWFCRAVVGENLCQEHYEEELEQGEVWRYSCQHNNCATRNLDPDE